MGALPEASVNAVESTLYRDFSLVLFDLAVRTTIFGVAHTGSVVAPTSIATVVRAGLETAIIGAPAWLAPAGSVQAKAVV